MCRASHMTTAHIYYVTHTHTHKEAPIGWDSPACVDHMLNQYLHLSTFLVQKISPSEVFEVALGIRNGYCLQPFRLIHQSSNWFHRSTAVISFMAIANATRPVCKSWPLPQQAVSGQFCTPMDVKHLPVSRQWIEWGGWMEEGCTEQDNYRDGEESVSGPEGWNWWQQHMSNSEPLVGPDPSEWSSVDLHQ